MNVAGHGPKALVTPSRAWLVSACFVALVLERLQDVGRLAHGRRVRPAPNGRKAGSQRPAGPTLVAHASDGSVKDGPKLFAQHEVEHFRAMTRG
jgi:hypothetical protein